MALQLSTLIREKPSTLRISPYAEIPYEDFPLEYDPASGRHERLPREWQEVAFVVRTPNLSVFQRLNNEDLAARVDYMVDALIRGCEGIEDGEGNPVPYDKRLRALLKKQFMSSPFLLKSFQDAYIERWEKSSREEEERDRDFFEASSDTSASSQDPAQET